MGRSGQIAPGGSAWRALGGPWEELGEMLPAKIAAKSDGAERNPDVLRGPNTTTLVCQPVACDARP